MEFVQTQEKSLRLHLLTEDAKKKTFKNGSARTNLPQKLIRPGRRTELNEINNHRTSRVRVNIMAICVKTQY